MAAVPTATLPKAQFTGTGAASARNLPIIRYVDLATLGHQISRSENLSVLPQIMVTILRKASDPLVSAAELEKLFEREPALVGKIIRTANSSYYGLREPLTSISMAITLLGLRMVQSLVFALAYAQVITAPSRSSKFDRLAFWRHSLCVATAARLIGKKRSPELMDELYMVGLVHDLGLLALERHYPVELDRLIEVASEQGKSLADTEKEIFTFDRTDVGTILAQRWNLGPRVVNALLYHRTPTEDTIAPELSCGVNLADAIAYRAGFPLQPFEPTLEVHQGALQTMGLSEEDIDGLAAKASEEVSNSQLVYGIP